MVAVEQQEMATQAEASQDDGMAIAKRIVRDVMPDATRLRYAAGGGVQGDRLARLVSEACEEAKIPQFKVFICKSEGANLATADGVIVATETKLQDMSDDELKAVVLHEIGHNFVPPNPIVRTFQRISDVCHSFMRSPKAGLASIFHTAKDSVEGFAAHVMAWVPGVLKRHKDRVSEVDSDRFALNHGANAHALVSGLRKLEGYNRGVSEVSAAVLGKAQSLGEALKKIITNPWQDHPDLGHRFSRIQEASRKQNGPAPKITVGY